MKFDGGRKEMGTEEQELASYKARRPGSQNRIK
jgi:hypothetical protein